MLENISGRHGMFVVHSITLLYICSINMEKTQ